MIEGLQPYSEYKESDIPWARVLPSNWQTERAKRLFTKMQRPVRAEDEVVTCFRDGRVTLRKNRRLRGFTEATAFSGYQGIRKGDLVIHGMDAFAGAIGVSDSDGKGTPVYNVCQPQPGIHAAYYAHTVREMSRAQWILALAKGIRERSTDFRYETFGNQFVPLPPPDEQAAIVRFLDHANRKIDGFIRAKRKLIGLLNEQKQAIIHRAVTRGLNPNVPLKPSGIPWLGDIPQHWEIRRMKYLLKEIDRRSLTGSETLLRVSQYTGITPRLAADGSGKAETRAESLVGYKRVQPNDMVINIMLAWNGSLAVSEHDGIVSPAYCVYRFNQGLHPWFFHHLLRTTTYKGRIRIASTGVIESRLRLYSDDLGRIEAIIPPLQEQRAITDSILDETHGLSTAIARTAREIALMQEYRTRLTADVVTGKLDVRAPAAKLPEITKKPELDLDETDETEDLGDES
jgi:type I restriction enzyme S subunit